MLEIDKSEPTPVYRQIYNYFRDGILDGSLEAGSCLPSIRQLQAETGVARESIKRAMMDLANDDFIRKIQGKGTFVAPRKPAKRFWGITVPFYAEFYNQMIVELRRVAGEEGILIEHACDYDSWEKQVEIVKDYAWRRAEAIIVVPTRDEPKTIPHFQKVSRHQSLLMLFDRSSIASQFPYVIQDYVLGVRAAMRAMTLGGSSRIAYVRDPFWIGENPIRQTMEEAYSQFCSDIPGGYCRFWDSPYDFARADLKDPEFDGLLCEDDQVACLVTGLLGEQGIEVPGQVQVAGYNNSSVGRLFTPQISTVCPNLPGMCEMVLDIIRRFKESEKIELLQYVAIPKFLARGTTRPLPADADLESAELVIEGNSGGQGKW